MAIKLKSTELTEDGLALGLTSRHLRMLAVGGSIGVGLFLGSGAGIAVAGPSLILVYAVVGAVIFVIMRALGELLIYRPVTGSFTEYAREFLGPAFGFITGWGNWITWTLIGMSEITAAGIFVQFWFPDVPQWVTALVAVICLVLLNLLHVGAFGEAEFWFASIKIIAIVGLILGGLAVILFGIGPAGQTASLGNLFNLEVPGTQGGFAPFGIIGILFAIQIAVFSYQGAELLGMAASETRNRRVVVPKAINSVPLRIILFYVGSLVILMSVVEWNKFSGNQSPFVQALEQIGIPAAAGLMNFVVLTSALSACSSGLFSNARLLKRLATDGVAPAIFASTNRNHVPAASVLASGGVMLLGVILNAVVPEQAFQYLLALCSLAALWTWGIILTTHMVYRRKVNRGELPPSEFKLPAAKVLVPVALTFLVGVVVLMAFDDSTRVALFALPFWAAALIGGYYFSKKFNPRHSILNEVAPTPSQSREELLVKTPQG
ncbi:amino acid permease [Paenarthrobacter aromaticivorans]|uniref:amino acid permease n=1 Tax=Paenarthrobacter aromaticivorans TaxID=2849150 RepID=UPI003A8018DF